MSSARFKPNPSRKALEPILLKVREWNDHLELGTPLRLIRVDMERGELHNRHLSDDDLVEAIREMGRISRRLPNDPGEAATKLLTAMGL